MKTFQFKCTTLSDVILNVKSATEGNQQTLDFIPGSSFLGVSAGALYSSMPKNQAMHIFHSGKVRFGDAHPLVNGKRAFRTPLSWVYPKNAEINDGLYIHNTLPTEGLSDEHGNPIQLKQRRRNYFLHRTGKQYEEIKILKSFAIKSAYDSDKRRSEDAKMFGYEAIRSGSDWCFEISFDDDISTELIDKVIGSLTGNIRIGRSSTAQFGLVKVVKENYNEGYSQADLKDSVIIYAESRLMLLDEFGQPKLVPTAADFGFKTGKIDWEKSQVRNFQYAPFNGARMTYDNDRCGIEKGSVLFIEGVDVSDADHDLLKRGVGIYLNEGFGQVLVNPAFLANIADDPDGKADVEIVSVEAGKAVKEPSGKPLSEKASRSDKLVFQHLTQEKQKNDEELKILNAVNDFVHNNERIFRGAKFASQWGTIRSKAIISESKSDLIIKLFDKDDGYLTHGVAKEKWAERKRSQLLKDFINKELYNFSDRAVIKTIVNLSAEMAKKSK